MADDSPAPSDTLSAQSNTDTQLASLLAEIEQTLLKNEGAPSDEVVNRLVGALELVKASSATGRRLMIEFPDRLRERAGEERAHGNENMAVYLSAFADAIRPFTQLEMERTSDERKQSSLAEPVPDQDGAAGRQQPEEPKQATIPVESTRETEKPAAETSASRMPADDKPQDVAVSNAQPTQQDQVTPPPGEPAKAVGDDGPPRQPDPASVDAPTSPEVNPKQAETLAPDAPAANVASSAQTAMVTPAMPHAMPDGAIQAPAIPKTQIALPSVTLAPAVQQSLLSRGDAMLRLGDIVAARMLFAHAASSGVGVAALKVGDTYNPAVLAGLNVLGIKADLAEAEAWYRKAQMLGEPQANDRLEMLRDRR